MIGVVQRAPARFALACVSCSRSGHRRVALADWPAGVAKIAVPTSRVVGHDIYGSAVAAAQRAYPGLGGVSPCRHRLGRAGALSDAAVASSLCWAYDAPLLLVGRNSLPAATREALAVDRLGEPHGDRARRGLVGTISAACARADPVRRAERQPSSSRGRPPAATRSQRRSRSGCASSPAETGQRRPERSRFVANGSDPKRLWDAAAASAVSRRHGHPDSSHGQRRACRPRPRRRWRGRQPSRVIVVGGEATVSSVDVREARRERALGWRDRYATAVVGCEPRESRGLQRRGHVRGAGHDPATPSSAPQLVGARGGVLALLGQGPAATRPRGRSSRRARRALTSAYAFGGASIADVPGRRAAGRGGQPWFESGAPGRYVGKRFRVTGWVGGNTTPVAIYVHGKKVRTIP